MNLPISFTMNYPNRKLLFVLPAFYRNGAVDLVVNLSEELADLEQQVTILAVQSVEKHSRLPKASVRVEIAVSSGKSLKLNIHQYLTKLAKEIALADVVFLPWENGPAFTYPSLIARLLNKPTVAIVQNNLQKTAIDYPNAISPHLTRWAYSQAKAVVCVSQDLKAIALSELKLQKERVTGICNGMNLETIRAKAKQPDSTDLFLNNDVPTVVAIGRLASQKGFDLLIQSHAEVIRKGIKHQLIVLGEGEDLVTLQQLTQKLGVASSVNFLGFVANPLPILAKADLFCMSSRYEGLPLSLIEAAILGVPAISTNCPTGPREVLANGRYGDLVANESVTELTNAIARHLQNPQRLAAKAKASQENVQRLSMQSCARRYLALTNRLLERSAIDISIRSNPVEDFG